MSKYRKTYIREWRESRGLSLRQLADRIDGISHASISRIENGLQPYTQPVVEAIALALGVSVSALLEVDPGATDDASGLIAALEPDKRAEALRFLRFLAEK